MGGLHPQPGVNYPAHFKTMETNDDLMFHHSLMDADRAKRRCDTVRAWLMAALVAGMFGAGVCVGIMLH